MTRRTLIAGIVLIGICAGCTVRGKLPRTADFHGFWNPADSAKPNTADAASFDGHLRLLYEFKTKGAVDGPLLTSGRYLAFRSTRDRILVVDLQDGHLIMQLRRRWGILTEPVIMDSILILVQSQPLGRIQVINLHNGAVLREKDLNEIRSGPIIREKSLIFGTGTGLISLSYPDLGVKWRYQSKGMVDIAPVIDSSAIYYNDCTGSVGKVAMADGTPLWEYNCKSSAVSELTLGSRLYCGLADGKLVAIDKNSGQEVWHYQAEFPIRGGTAEQDGKIYFGGGDGAVVCLDAATGEKQWSGKTEGVISARPLVYGQAVLVGSQDRTLYSFDKETGRQIGSQRLEGAVSQGAVVIGGKIFVSCRRSRMYCFEGIK